MTFALRERVERRILGALRCVDATTLCPSTIRCRLGAGRAPAAQPQRPLRHPQLDPPPRPRGRVRRAAGGAGRGQRIAGARRPRPDWQVPGTARRHCAASRSHACERGTAGFALPRRRRADVSGRQRSDQRQLGRAPRHGTGDRQRRRPGRRAAARRHRHGRARARVDRLARGSLVPVAGVPITTWSTEPGAVVVTEIPASLECYFDAGTARARRRRTCARASCRAACRCPTRRPSRTDVPRCRSRSCRSCSPPAARSAWRSRSPSHDLRDRTVTGEPLTATANREPANREPAAPVPHFCRSGRLIHA